MKRKRHDERDERARRYQRNLILVEWTAAVCGIFWSVWWGFFVQRILESSIETIPIGGREIPKGRVLLVSTLLICFYVFYFVRWMWGIHRMEPDSPAREWVTASWRMIVFVLPIIGIVFLATDFFNLSDAQTYYGVSLTVAWPILTGLEVWFSKEEVLQP